MEEERGDGRTAQDAEFSNSRNSDEASDAVEKEAVSTVGSSSPASQARSRNDTRKADAEPDEVQMDKRDSGQAATLERLMRSRRFLRASEFTQ